PLISRRSPTRGASDLARGVLPDQGAGVVDDAAGLFAAAGGAEVAQQPGAQALRLADVDEAAARVDHAVDAGAARALAAQPGPQRERKSTRLNSSHQII